MAINAIAAGYGVKVNLGEAPQCGADLPLSVRAAPVQVKVVGAIRRG